MVLVAGCKCIQYWMATKYICCFVQFLFPYHWYSSLHYYGILVKKFEYWFPSIPFSICVGKFLCISYMSTFIFILVFVYYLSACVSLLCDFGC
jgi:hypothetical protein